jgi:hypothetical protein
MFYSSSSHCQGNASWQGFVHHADINTDASSLFEMDAKVRELNDIDNNLSTPAPVIDQITSIRYKKNI